MFKELAFSLTLYRSPSKARSASKEGPEDRSRFGPLDDALRALLGDLDRVGSRAILKRYSVFARGPKTWKLNYSST